MKSLSQCDTIDSMNPEVENQLIKTAMSILGKRSQAANKGKKDFKAMSEAGKAGRAKYWADRRAKKLAEQSS